MSAKPVLASYCTTFLKPEMLHIYRQVSALSEFDNFVICRERKSEEKFPYPDVEIQPRVRSNFIRRFWLKYVKKEPPIVYRGEYQTLANILDRKRADLMHIYFGHTGVHLLPFIRRWPNPTIVSFHGMDVQPRENQPEYLGKLQQLLTEAPLVLARSESLKERLIDLGCDEAKIRINRTGIPVDNFPAIERKPPLIGSWKLIQACRLIEKKGLDLTLRAFADFRVEFPNAKLTIAGEGPLLPELEKQVAELELGDAVSFPGFLSETDLAKLYQESHIFVHPSRVTADQNQEGIPNSMLEAMATGLPVVATRHGGIPEAVKAGVTGLLGPENDWESVRDHLFEFARDPDRWTQFGAAAAADIRENFEHRAQIAKLEGFYREVLGDD
ncbi:MAG: glycosyltransferase [Verrucomicrobiota bacterium]